MRRQVDDAFVSVVCYPHMLCTGYKLQWMDKRKSVSKEALDLDHVEAVLVNVVLSSGFLRALFEQRHWFAIRKVSPSSPSLAGERGYSSLPCCGIEWQINGVVYNLDSKLDAPMVSVLMVVGVVEPTV